MNISWEEANQLMAEVINFFNEHGVDTSHLKGSMPDEYEQLANVFYDHRGEVWNGQYQVWLKEGEEPEEHPQDEL